MDILDGEGFTSKLFRFIDTTALNAQFEFFGVDSKIMILNTGSYFIL
jgi:hypothetical protein